MTKVGTAAVSVQQWGHRRSNVAAYRVGSGDLPPAPLVDSGVLLGSHIMVRASFDLLGRIPSSVCPSDL